VTHSVCFQINFPLNIVDCKSFSDVLSLGYFFSDSMNRAIGQSVLCFAFLW